MKQYGDITNLSGYCLEPVEVVIGGSPCQDLSAAGKRAGLQGSRSGLFLEQIRIIKEMRERDRQTRQAADVVFPRFMVWENVPGAMSANKGEDFRTVLEETAKIADETAAVPRPPAGKWTNSGCIMGDGWSLAWRVLDAQFWGVPQRRRRIALVADFGGIAAPEILFEREGVRGDSAKSKEAREKAPGNTGDGAVVYDTRGNGDGKTAPTLTGDHENRLTDYTAAVVYPGNQIASPVCKSNPKHGDPAPTLIAKGSENEILVYPDVAKTLTASNDGSPCPDRGSGANIVCMATGQAGAEITTNLSPTLNCDHEQPIAAYSHPQRQYIVRRLTPMECERLQGFPDGWTDLGSWTDSKGKTRKTSDSARYKALGNSIALPPWRYVLRRLSKYCTYGTMGSLFDGIGGFPMVWREIWGKDSCVWSSEIDEFCSAVTRQWDGGKEENP